MAVRAMGAAQIPDHVPRELVRSLGLTNGAEFLAQPYDYMARIARTEPPVIYDVSETNGNAWALLRHEDAFFALRHPEFFSTEDATPFPRDPSFPFQFIPIEIDPPEHRKYRAILDPVFSPQGVLKLEKSIRALTNGLIDEFIAKGQCEFTEVFGRPLPVCVFLDLMGLPQDMRDEFVTWAVGLLHSESREVAGQSMRSITAYLKQVIAEKTLTPDDGVISRIVHSEVDGAKMSELEIFGFVIFLFIAGLDTVFATMNNIWLWLAQNPGRRHEIIAKPDNMASVVEELLRVFTVTFSGRTVRKDVEIRGVKMKKGDKLTSILPVCNLDAEVFPDPTRVDFTRPRKPILAFAGGVHSCMGAHLARLEIRIGIEEWLKRIPEFSLKPGAEISYWPGGVIGPKRVDLVW